MEKTKSESYREVLFYFLRLGALGFGGPLAIVGSIQKDLIEKRKWMVEKDFNAIFSLIKAMPGPIAFQVAVFVGRERAGFVGGALAGFGLVVPAFCLMIVFSLFFKSISEFSFTHLILMGMQVSALGVILGSLKGLIKSNLKDFFFWFLIIVSALLNIKYPAIEPVIIIGFGLTIIFLKKWQRQKYQSSLMGFVAPALFFSSTIRDLAFVCFKAGALVFGTGLAIVPMLEHDVVEKYKWLSHSEFLNGLVMGQMTPGPVVITATYIGHKVAGVPGAVVATIAIFLAAFFHMSTWFPLVAKKLRGKIWINDFVFGAVASVVGPIIVTVFKMGSTLPLNSGLIILGLSAFFLTITNKIPLWLLIPAGGVINFLMIKLFSLI